MPFKILNIIIIFFSLTIYSYSAGTSGGKTKSNFDQASKLIKDAKKYEKGRWTLDSSTLDLSFYYLNKRLSGEKAPDYQEVLNIDTIRTYKIKVEKDHLILCISLNTYSQV